MNWYIKTRINGKLIYKSTKTPDIKKAELILSKVKVALLSLDSEVKQIIGKAIPFRQLMERYLTEISSEKRSQESDYFRSKPLIEFWGDSKIDTITTQDVYKYMDWRKGKVSGPTVNREISLLRHSFRKAIRWGYVDKNPSQGIEGFTENRRTRYISDQEFDAIKAIASSGKNSRYLSDVMDGLYFTAQRLGRILDLKWNQIDMKERTISFEQTSRTKRVPLLLWINEPMLRLLTRMRSERGLFKVVGPYVFQKSDGKPHTSINRLWRRCCRKSGVKDARIHDIRHKSITDMVRKGYSLESVGRVAGHSTPSTTAGYTHLSIDATKDALEAIGRGK